MCLPQNLSSLVVYYNRDLFDAAGVPYPEAGWTWADFLAAAKALTKDIDGDGLTDQHGLGVENSLIRFTPFIWQAGGELVDDVDHPTRLTIDTPQAREAIQFFIDLSLVHKVVPTEAEVLAISDEDRFITAPRRCCCKAGASYRPCARSRASPGTWRLCLNMRKRLASSTPMPTA